MCMTIEQYAHMEKKSVTIRFVAPMVAFGLRSVGPLLPFAAIYLEKWVLLQKFIPLQQCTGRCQKEVQWNCV